MPATSPLRLCVVGATGRMGGTIIKEAPADRFTITGAVAAEGESAIGKTLRELEIADIDLKVVPPSSLGEQLRSADVCISFTDAAAEVANIPTVAASARPLILGTTGFSDFQHAYVLEALTGKVPCVMASNFS